MQLTPYLNFNGQCETALRFYAKILGGEIETMFPYEGTEAEGYVPPEWRSKVMHACLAFAGQRLMGSDAPPDMYKPTQGMSVTLNIDDPAEAERVFHALAENGTVRMPLGETFWALRFGDLVDQFGTPWMINCPRPDWKPEVRQAGASQRNVA